MIDNTRHSGIFNASGWTVTLIGAGGIGSPTALALAKMGLDDINVYDSDFVDSVNVSTQMYGNLDIGEYKVEALRELVARYAEDVIVDNSSRIDRESYLHGDIIISAVDNITSRREIWEAVKSAGPAWYLDARMGAEKFQLFSVRIDRPSWYESLLYAVDDADIPDEPCTSKATIYCAFSAAGHIGRAVRMIVTGQHKAGFLDHNVRAETMYALEM